MVEQDFVSQFKMLTGDGLVMEDLCFLFVNSRVLIGFISQLFQLLTLKPPMSPHFINVSISFLNHPKFTML